MFGKRTAVLLTTCAGLLIAVCIALGQATLTIEQAIASLVANDPASAADPDLVIGDREIGQAIQLWITGSTVPRTGGQTIDDVVIKRLISLWISEEPVSTQPGPPPGPPGFSIQGAIGRAQPGEVIFIPAGTYRENLQIDRAITLAAERGGQVVIQGDAQNPTVRVNINTGGVTLRGLHIQGGSTAILLMGNSETTVEDSVIAGSGVGIEIVHQASAVLNRNAISGHARAGVSLDTESDTLLLDNAIERNGGDGVLILNRATAQLKNNRVQDNHGAGVRLNDTLGVTISGNLIQKNGENGVHVERSSRVTLSDNTLLDQGGHGVHLADNAKVIALEGNTISRSAGAGVLGMRNVQVTLEDNQITETVAVSGQAGVGALFDTDVQAQLRDNTISDNDGSGLEAWRETRIEAAGNTLSNNDGFGLFIDTTSSISCEGQNLVFGNVQDVSAFVPDACLS